MPNIPGGIRTIPCTFISFVLLGLLTFLANMKPLFVGTGTWQTGIFFVWANKLNPQKMSANKTFILNLVIYSFEFEPNPEVSFQIVLANLINFRTFII